MVSTADEGRAAEALVPMEGPAEGPRGPAETAAKGDRPTGFLSEQWFHLRFLFYFIWREKNANAICINHCFSEKKRSAGGWGPGVALLRLRALPQGVEDAMCALRILRPQPQYGY